MNNHEQAVHATPLFTTKELTLIGLMAAVTCVLGPFSIPLPFSPVPISFTNLAIYLAVFVLGMKKGFVSYLVYFLIGLAGVPVFSGFSGGMGKVAGPTGGYLIGFFFLVLIAGYFIDHFHAKKFPAALGMILGTAVCYLFGTVWLSWQLGISFTASLGTGVIPYLPGDTIKIVVALILGPILRQAVSRL